MKLARSIGLESLPLMSMATSMSPAMRRTMWRGRGLRMPPSMSSLSPIFTGSKKSGILIDARTAWNRLPVRKTTSSVWLMSEATMAQGISSSSIGRSGTTFSNSFIMRFPLTSELLLSRLMSNMRRINCLSTRKNHSLASLSCPAAYIPAMMAPMEQPAILVIV